MHPVRALCQRCVGSVAAFTRWWSVAGVLTASSIGAAKGGGYARYLESKTVEPDRGDYYLNAEGEPTQAPGRWLAAADTLARLGIDDGRVDGQDFVAMMEGRHPRSGGWLRAAGANGARGGGIDLTFSAPKSVSAVWALGTVAQRREMEEAHAAAVAAADGASDRDGPNCSPSCWRSPARGACQGLGRGRVPAHHRARGPGW